MAATSRASPGPSPRTGLFDRLRYDACFVGSSQVCDVVDDVAFAYKGHKAEDQHRTTGFLKIRERYVRSDVPCGVASCRACQKLVQQLQRRHSASGLESPAQWRVFQRAESMELRRVCFVTLEVLLFYTPLLEKAVGAFPYVVVLQSDLERFQKEASGAQWKALRQLMERPEVVVYLFANEHHRDCFVSQPEAVAFQERVAQSLHVPVPISVSKQLARDDKSNDAASASANAAVDSLVFAGNLCALFKALKWFTEHLAKESEDPPELCLLHRSALVGAEFERQFSSSKTACQISAIRVDDSFPLRYCASSEVDALSGQAASSDAVALARDLFQTLFVSEKAAIRKASAGAATAAAERLSAAAEVLSDGVLNFTGEAGMSAAEVKRRIKLGRYIRGTLAVKARKTWQAYVVRDDGLQEDAQSIFVPSRDLQNRALDGDVVAVQLLPESEWVADINDVHSAGFGQVAKSGILPTGRVVAVLRRNKRPYVATILQRSEGFASESNSSRALAVPQNPRLPKIRIRTSQVEALTGHRIVVVMDGWEAGSTYPEGHYVQDLGPCGELDTELKALMVELEMTTHLLSHSAEGIAEVSDWANEEYDRQNVSIRLSNESHGNNEDATQTSEQQHRVGKHREYSTHDIPDTKLFEAQDRVDLREVAGSIDGSKPNASSMPFFVFSVDPNGCTDIDDAMSIRRIPGPVDGEVSYELGVHIADVTSVIRRESRLDLEARRRGTTLYFPDRRLDMIPPVLSADVCSLLPQHDRAAVSVFFELDENFDVRRVKTQKRRPPADGSPRSEDEVEEVEEERVWQGRTALRSEFALTYSQAQRLLQNKPADPPKHKSFPAAVSELKSAGTPVPREDEARVREALQLLTAVANRQHMKRQKCGALALSSNQLEFELENDNKNAVREAVDPLSSHHDNEAASEEPQMANVQSVHSHEHLPVMDVVAELMIMANSAVAKRIYSAFPGQAILRCHRPPERDRLSKLEAAAEDLLMSTHLEPKAHQRSQLHFSTGSNIEFQHFLETARTVFRPSRSDSPNDAVSKRVGLDFLNALAVGSMSEAKYVSSGADRHGLNEQRDEVWVQKGGADSLRGDDGAVDGGDDQLNLQRNGAGTFRFGHFGLAMEYYTHFTSPIRRYADVLVHRCLIEGGVMGGRGGYVPACFRHSIDNAARSSDSAQTPPNGSLNPVPPFSTEAMHDMCEHLNKQTRLAKALNRDVNELFLSLLCAATPQYARAVVSGLRENGLVVYIPSFNKGGVVHLANPDGEFLQLAFQEKLLPSVYRLSGARGSRSGDDDADAPEKEDDGDELTFPASSSLRSDGSQLAIKSEYLQDGSTQFNLYQGLFVRLTCSFSPASPRPSRIKISLVSQQDFVARTCSKSDNDAHFSETSDGASNHGRGERTGKGDAGSDNTLGYEDSIYSSLSTVLERIEHSPLEKIKSSDGSSSATDKVPSKPKQPKHPRTIVHNLGHFRFGKVAKATPQATSRAVASLGRLSHQTVSSGNKTGARSEARVSPNLSAGGTGLSARTTLEGAARNPMGKQARQLKALETQALERARKLKKAKGKSRKYG